MKKLPYLLIGYGNNYMTRQNIYAYDFETQINELDNMMNTIKITSQVSGETAIRSRLFLVGSISAGGDVSFAANPTVHYTAGSARNECKRLAGANPGKTFIFVRLEGAERAVPTPTLVSI